MIYCDASLFVSLITAEVHSEAAEQWVERCAGEPLAISPWVLTEVASALAMKRRRDAISEEGWRSASAQALQLAAESFTSLAIESVHFELAGSRMVRAGARGLRSGDALHLAIAADYEVGLASLDDALNDAADSIGVPVSRVLISF